MRAGPIGSGTRESFTEGTGPFNDTPGCLLNLYDPATRGNSFSLDGFPTPKDGEDWLGRLKRLIAEKGILGMTTNQTLFRQLVETGALDRRLISLKATGFKPKQIYRILYEEVSIEAARLFADLNARWPWEGRVSQEASALETDLDPLVGEIQRIAVAMGKVGAFTKIPNLSRIGPMAIGKAVSSGSVHPNVTLVFSDRHYLETVEGYLDGLETLVDRLQREGWSSQEIGRRIQAIHSVNSLFVSRVDRAVDPMIEARLRRCGESEQKTLSLLKGKTALAQAKKVYQMFETIFLGRPFLDPLGLYEGEGEPARLRMKLETLQARFHRLKAFGAQPQRVLMASTGVKSDQPYSPLLYVLPLLGPWSCHTMPEGTLEQFSDFLARIPDKKIEMLKTRKMIAEPLLALPTDLTPTDRWDEAVLMTPEERKRNGIAELGADCVLEAVDRLVLRPAGTDLRQICDLLRDQGASAFTRDEQATLQAIETKLATL